jgi:hypothetical protein
MLHIKVEGYTPLCSNFSDFPFCPFDNRPELAKIGFSITKETTPDEFEKSISKISNVNLASRVSRKGVEISEDSFKTSQSFLKIAMDKKNPDLQKFLINHIKPQFFNHRLYSLGPIHDDSDKLSNFLFSKIMDHIQATHEIKIECYEPSKVKLKKRMDDNLEIIRLLLSKGVETNLFYNYYTPLSIPLNQNIVDLSQLLVDFGARKLAMISPSGCNVVEEKFEPEAEEIYKNALKIFHQRIRLIQLSTLDQGSTFHLPKDVIKVISNLYTANPYEQVVNHAKLGMYFM